MGREQNDKVGLAMYTIHNSVQADLRAALEQAAQLGYEGIEFYGEPAFDKTLVRDALAASGLELTGWHIEWRSLQPDIAGRTIAYLNDVGCPLAVVPCLGGKWNVAHAPAQECEDTWKRHIAWLNETAERLARQGLRLGYHNHEHEFLLRYGGKPLFDYLFDSLSQEIVMEFDSGNCIEGGDDPVRVLEKYKARPMILHMKPFSHTRGFETTLGAPDDANDWAAMLAPGRYPFAWRLVESECTVLPEMENVRLCMEGLRPYLKRTMEQ